MKTSHHCDRPLPTHSVQGFTVTELLVVVAMIATLGTMALFFWWSFIQQQRLNASVERIYYALQEAQSNAKRDKINWQVSVRDETSTRQPLVQWAIHPALDSHTSLETLNWRTLDPNIQIDSSNTTFYQYPESNSANQGIWRVQFDEHGDTNGRLGRITLASRSTRTVKRQCVFVSTLIGTLRTASDHTCD